MGFSGENVGAIHATLDLDRDPFIRALEWARAQVKRFEDERHRVTIDVVLSAFEKAKAQLAEIHDKTVKVKVQVDRSQLAGLLGAGGVNVADAAALAKLEELQRKIDAVHGKTVDVKVNTSTAGRALDLLKTKWGALRAGAAKCRCCPFEAARRRSATR